MLLLWRAAVDDGAVQVGGDLVHLVTWAQGAVTPRSYREIEEEVNNFEK